jgi:tetratricopeptide (TPR) repeat protein
MIGYRLPVRQLLILLSLAAPAAARPTSVTPEMDRLLLEGVDAIYRMDFAGADAACAKAIALDPGYPHAYLGRAAIDLIRFSYGTEQSDPSLIGSFEAKTLETIKVAEARLKTSPRDPDVLFVLGAAHGVAGRMAIVRRQWLKAFGHGRASMKSVRLAARLAPELYDAQLGLGMFDYYVATIPKFAGWLAKIVLGGDRERGIKLVKIAAEKGHYGKTAAQLILVEIFLEDKFGAANPPEGLRLTRGIVAQYPDSPMLHSAFIVALHSDKKWDEAISQAREFQARVKSGKYPPLNLAKSHALLGTVLWASGDKAGALEEFLAGSEARGGGARTRWMVWSRVRAGQVLDALGRRADALAAYKAAYAEKDDWGYRELIKPCLKKPCVGANYPGHFSPY